MAGPMDAPPASPPDRGLDGRAVLVTGAARRLGAAIARQLHACGADLAVHCRRSVADAHELAAELCAARPDSATVITGDLADAQSAPAVVAAAVAAFGRLDALVNNAAAFAPGGADPADLAVWDEAQAVNARAPWLLAEAAAPALRARGGCVVNILDIYAWRPLPGYPAYSVSQAALAGATRALALELAPAVRVNGIAPGAILWPAADDGRDRRAIVDSTALGRAGEPADVAAAALFLIRDATYLTGEIVAVDGGRSLRF